MSLEERVAQWREPYIQQGINLGMEHERQLLRRLAAARFDSATAERLAAAIGTEADPQRLEEVGEAIALRDGQRTAAESRQPSLTSADDLLLGLFATPKTRHAR